MIIKKRYFQCCIVLLVLAALTLNIAQAQDPKESDLIAVLKSDAPKAEKAITCKSLAIYGTEKAVPDISPLLGDKELSSWARIALEAIPAPAADTALRDALDKVEGRQLVGVINSIAVRRDAKAVDPLIKKLDDPNADIASAAAVALGHLGGDKAAKTLTQYLTKAPTGVRSAVAQGCILAAEGFLANDDNTNAAVKLYDNVRKADVPDQRHLEAIRGAILAHGANGVPLLVEQLQSKDKKRLQIGLRTARELGGQKVTEFLAAELTELSPDRRPLLLLAIADRKDSAVLPTVLKAAAGNQKDLRITAINILIRLGDVSSVPVLLEAAMEDDAQLEQAAMETLVRLPDRKVDSDFVNRLQKAKGKQRRILIELTGQRQIANALPQVVSSLDDNDPAVRIEAVRTIAIIGNDRQAANLVRMLQETTESKERADIRKSLMAICGRTGQKCVPHLKPLTNSNDSQLHIMGLQALAIIGGPDALDAVNAAIKNAQPQLQDQAVRILSTWPNNWPQDTNAGQALLTLAGSAEKMSHKVLAIRGYLQYLRGNKKLNNQQKVDGVKKVLAHADRPEEKLQAIAVLGDAPSATALDLLKTMAADPALAEGAYSAMVTVAASDNSGISKDNRKQILQTVGEKSKNNGTKQRAKKTFSKIP